MDRALEREVDRTISWRPVPAEPPLDASALRQWRRGAGVFRQLLSIGLRDIAVRRACEELHAVRHGRAWIGNAVVVLPDGSDVLDTDPSWITAVASQAGEPGVDSGTVLVQWLSRHGRVCVEVILSVDCAQRPARRLPEPVPVAVLAW